MRGLNRLNRYPRLAKAEILTEDRAHILRFVQEQGLTVLSTVSADGNPESATVECVVTDDFEIIFDTFQHFRKYTNLQANKRISAVFGWRDDITVQFEGEAEELSGELLDHYQGYYLRKIPSARKFAEMKDISWFRVIPKWARFTDVSREPWEIIELDLASSYTRPETLANQDNS